MVDDKVEYFGDASEGVFSQLILQGFVIDVNLNR
jgi:hypothetical protein